MAITVGGHAACADPVAFGSVVATDAFAVSPGQFIEVWVRGASDSSMSTVVVTDTNGNTYTNASDGTTTGAIGSSDIKCVAYWAQNSSSNAALVVTATMPGVNPVEAFTVHASALSGVLGSGNPVARYGGQSQATITAGTDNCTTGTLTAPGTDGCIVTACCGVNTWPDTFVAGTGYTGFSGESPNNPSTRFAYLIQTTSAAITATFSSDDTTPPRGTTAAVAYKPAAGASTYTLTCTQASYALTGNATGLTAARKLTCDQQSYALTGQAVTLTYTSGGARTLTCDQVSYTLTGFDTVLSPQSPPAFYTLTGTDVGLLASTRVLTCVQASYGLTGNATNFLTTHALTCDQASYTLTGPATNLVYSNAPATSGVGIDSVRARLRPYLGVKRRMVASLL